MIQDRSYLKDRLLDRTANDETAVLRSANKVCAKPREAPCCRQLLETKMDALCDDELATVEPR